MENPGIAGQCKVLVCMYRWLTAKTQKVRRVGRREASRYTKRFTQPAGQNYASQYFGVLLEGVCRSSENCKSCAMWQLSLGGSNGRLCCPRFSHGIWEGLRNAGRPAVCHAGSKSVHTRHRHQSIIMIFRKPDSQCFCQPMSTRITRPFAPLSTSSPSSTESTAIPALRHKSAGKFERAMEKVMRPYPSYRRVPHEDGDGNRKKPEPMWLTQYHIKESISNAQHAKLAIGLGSAEQRNAKRKREAQERSHEAKEYWGRTLELMRENRIRAVEGGV